VDGTQRIDIPNGGTYQIVDVTWDDPETVLVQRSIETRPSCPSSMSTPARSRPWPRRRSIQGGFVLDSKRNVRYAVGAKEEGITQVTLRRDGDELDHRCTKPRWAGLVQRPLGFDREDKNVLFYLSDTGEPIGRVDDGSRGRRRAKPG
jgi:hypothetical protein